MEEEGYSVQTAGDGESALRLAGETRFDLVVLDVMLPGMSGFETCRALRASGFTGSILIITARDRLEDKIEGLDSGADDYVVKPFQVAELLARARAVLRRSAGPSGVLTVADLKLEPASRKATRAGKAVNLSSTEYALLELLMRNADRVLTRGEILQHVWQYDFGGNDNVLDVYISYLRNKIDKGHEPPLIHTVRGVGFRMSAGDAA